jgi:GalNAc-alpha-(1->4)-GalNAc-alpha-(1->3)-diNAcBac-PP-undecaprenol alpha-1,4-N-acetyl-D-galactosaminyltransferase
MHVRPRRITLLIHALTGGGAERQIASLANYLASQSFDTTLMTLDRQGNDRYALHSTVQRIGLDQMQPSRSSWDALAANRQRIIAVREAVRRSQPDCVISFCDKMNIVSIAACQPLRVPLIISERSDPRRQKLGWYWEAARRWLYPQCTAVVAQTKSVANYLQKIIGSQAKIKVIPSGIEPPPVSTETDVHNESEQTLLYVGRLSAEKGPDRLIRTWSKIASNHPSWKLKMIGEGPLQAKLQQLCYDLNLQHRVEFTGWQTDVWTQLHRANALVLPSHYEGFPGIVIEAMYAKLAVVATDCSDSIRELIDDEQTGLIAKNADDSLAEPLSRLLSDSQLREQLGLAARRKAERYQWSHLGAQWLQLIDECC